MKKSILYMALSAVMLPACINLDETLYSSIGSDEWYTTEEECVLAMGSAYANLQYRGTSLWGWLGLECLTTDEAVVPIHDEGGYLDNDGIWIQLHEHYFTPNQDPVNASWEVCFGTVSSCNQIIYQIENSPVSFEGKESMIAELRTLRAFVLYKALDLFGNIPIVLDFEDTSLPEQLTRTEAFGIIEKELCESYPLLQSQPTSQNYGRCTKAVAFSILAKMYINAEKWTGNNRYEDAVAMCDSIIKLNYYSLEEDYYKNFCIDNSSSREMIFALPYDRLMGDFGFQMHMYTLHWALRDKYNITADVWNGLCMTESMYDSFDDADLRKKGWLIGPQYNNDGTPVMGYKHGPLVFDKHISSIRNTPEGEGVRCFKWEMNEGLKGWETMDNDFALFRYADILLLKAEALMRKAGVSVSSDKEVLDCVNQVRARAFGNEDHNYDEITLDELLAERGRELAFEEHRRQDLIRFGKYGDAWDFKEPSDRNKELFPIPSSALNANPNLKQNPL